MRTAAQSELLVGIFVGGRGERLGGVAKGLLQAPDSRLTLIERLLKELRGAVPAAELVLVGAADAYSDLGLRSVADAPTGVGPLGGLLGALQHAQQGGQARLLALACDLPYVERSLIARLATELPHAPALLTSSGGIRNPLFARYAIREALPAARAVLGSGRRSLQAVLDQLGGDVHSLLLSDAEAASLRDWDTPDDMTGSTPS